MGKNTDKRLSMAEEIEKRKADPDWCRNLASSVVKRHKKESESKGNLFAFPVRNLLAAAAILLVSASVGWFAVSNLVPQDDEVMHGISLLVEGESYLSSLEE